MQELRDTGKMNKWFLCLIIIWEKCRVLLGIVICVGMGGCSDRWPNDIQ